MIQQKTWLLWHILEVLAAIKAKYANIDMSTIS